jgi:hypothetical protein
MISENSNPFNITKAVDFSDSEIVSFWVDITDDKENSGFSRLIKPTSPMPMYILGGKGSGKTHLMRYFSFACQSLRNSKDVASGIANEGYLGAYVLCGGISADRFKGKNKSDELWDDVFAYSLELWLSQILLENVINGKFIETTENEQSLLKKIAHLFGKSDQFEKLPDVLEHLRKLQLNVDRSVNNILLKNEFNLHIEFSRGQLIYGLPSALRSCIPMLSNCLMVYLIDEFENLSKRQQKYINTLVRERKEGSSFKVGSRLYGIKTHQTFSDNEENKEGSEFEYLYVDTQLRKDEKIYRDFSLKLISSRLNRSGLANFAEDLPTKALQQDLGSHFSERTVEELARTATGKYGDEHAPWLDDLFEKLERGLRSGASPGINDLNDIKEIITCLRQTDKALLEKLNCFQLFKDWSKNHNLLKSAQEVNKDCSRFIEGDRDSRYADTYNKFKLDLLAQLLRTAGYPQKYIGLDTLIKMSWGVPRHLFIILKNIFAWSDFKGERPFTGGIISEDAQVSGVSESANWFFEDSRSFGPKGHRIQVGVERLATLLRTIRFSDKPSECSPSSFSCDFSSISEPAINLIKDAERWSLLVNAGRRRHKNSKRMLNQFQLNRMLAPKWDLPIARRGVVELSPVEIEAIFVTADDTDFSKILDRRSSRMEAPFFQKKSDDRELDLFANPEHND